MLWSQKARVLFSTQTGRHRVCNAEQCEWYLLLDAFILPVKISLLAVPESRTFTGRAEEVNVNMKFGISSGLHGVYIPKSVVNGGI